MLLLHVCCFKVYNINGHSYIIYMYATFLNYCRPTTYAGHVILEIVTTERTYVGDLTDIVEVHVHAHVCMCVYVCCVFLP